jgi:riboflavin synthase
VFSGLIASIGTVAAMSRRGEGGALEVRGSLPGGLLALGESIAVNGACLTVSRAGEGGFLADVSPETLARTTLGGLRPGERVNLERALRLDERLGGHLVLGHVDGVGRLVAVRPQGAFRVLRFSFPMTLALEVAEKGSVAVDGISLTVTVVGKGWFEVALIPATLAATTLVERRPGDRVNLETDVLAKYVLRALGKARPGLQDSLSELLHETD